MTQDWLHASEHERRGCIAHIGIDRNCQRLLKCHRAATNGKVEGDCLSVLIRIEGEMKHRNARIHPKRRIRHLSLHPAHLRTNNRRQRTYRLGDTTQLYHGDHRHTVRILAEREVERQRKQ